MDAVKSSDIVREEEFCRLVETYQLPLLRMCAVYLRDRALAEDAVQETFLKVLKTSGSFRGECSEKTWLMRIAMNTCHDMMRTGWFRHVDRRISPELLPEPSEEMNTAAMELMEEIVKLPPRLREVVLLYYYQDLTVYEVAQALNIHHATVSKRLKKAKERLQIAMKGACFNER